MSNVHVIALPRTGSKALDRALRHANPGHLAYNTHQALAEYLHCRGSCDFKFSERSEYPFQYLEHGDNMMMNNVEFFTAKSKNFKPEYDAENGCLKWMPSEFSPVLTEELFAEAIETLIIAWRETKKPIILKTFLSVMLGDQWAEGIRNSSIRSGIRALHHEIPFTKIGLYRRDAMSWICSRVLMNRTGAFVQSANQKEKIEWLKSNPILIDIHAIKVHLSLLKSHLDSLACLPFDMVVATEDLSASSEALSHVVGGEVKVEKLTEFSATDYKDVIQNYDFVKSVVDQYLQPVIREFESLI